MMKLRLGLSEEGQAMREMEVGREGDGGGGRKDEIGEAVEKKKKKETNQTRPDSIRVVFKAVM